MKFRELIESYFPGLYHISPKKNLKVDLSKKIQSGMMNKPTDAFWLAKGLSWHKWATDEDYSDTANQYLYRVKLKSKASILQINKNNYKKYLVRETQVPLIDWKKLAKKYDGVQIYNVKKFPAFKKFIMNPFYAWDVPSVVLFNKKVIQSIEPLGKVKDAIKQRRKK